MNTNKGIKPSPYRASGCLPGRRGKMSELVDPVDDPTALSDVIIMQITMIQGNRGTVDTEEQ